MFDSFDENGNAVTTMPPKKPLVPLGQDPTLPPPVGGPPPGVSVQPPVPGMPPVAPPAGGQPMIIPPAPQGAVPSLFDGSGPSSSSFGAGNNLIGTQLNPGQADPNGYLNSAASNIGQATLQPLGADVGTARNTAIGALGQLDSAPSRSATASNLYDALSKQDAANQGADIRSLGQRSAALGRLGSGMVNSEAGDIFGQHEANLASIKAQLAAGTAGQEQGDLLNKIGAASGLATGFGGMDTSRGATGAGLALSRAGALGGLQGQEYGQNIGDLNFLQGERGYQQGLDQQNVQNNVQQQQLQDSLLNSDFGRQAQQAGMEGQYGFGTSPTGQSLADMYSGQSGDTQSAIAQLLQSLGQRGA